MSSSLLVTSGVATSTNSLRAEVAKSGESLAKARIQGLLLGSAIGDAVGGPVEFQKPEAVSEIMATCRDWPDDRKLTSEDRKTFASHLNQPISPRQSSIF